MLNYRPASLGILAIMAAVLAFDSGVAQAQARYPGGPIKVVVPFLGGGSVDTLLRIVAPRLSESWGQPVVVENKAGAGGNIGADIVAKALPDGYTVLFTPSGPLSLNMFLYERLPFDASSAFAPVTILALMPNMLLVGPRVQAKRISELIADARANPGKLSYGSPGVGTVSHLTAELLASATGSTMVHIPYKGFPPLLADLIGGRLDFAILDATNALPQIRNGHLRALAIAHPKRFFALPEVPTFAETGIDGVIASTWVSFLLPAGTPQEIVRKWHEELSRIAKIPEVRDRFEQLGAELWVSTPDELRRYVDEEKGKWKSAIERAGIGKR